MSATGLVQATVVHADGRVAVSALTLLAEPGELLVVLGPSGSGKTTVLRAVAGLAKLQSGRVLIGGTDVTPRRPEERDVAMVFESSELMPFMDVAQNLGLGLKLRRTPKAEVDARVHTQARGLRLTRLLSRKASTLSEGERAQVGIGRALIRVPSVFLLDEPLAHQDAATRATMRRHIADAVKGLGVTTIYVTHDQSEALAIGDRIAVLQAGTVVQVAAGRELYDRPASIFVAAFLGAVRIGLLPARLVVSSGMAGFQVGARTLPLWGPAPDELRDRIGQELLLGIRAEHVHDAAADTHADLATLPGVVTRVEFAGSQTLVDVAVAAPPPRAPGVELADSRASSASLRARFPAHTTARVGSAVQVSVDVRRAHVFEPTTGRALHHLAAARAD